MSRYDLSLPAGRRRAYLDYLWKDHAYLRVGFQNAHWISPELVRTNQPWPHQLKWWRDHGIRTVINLRGGFDGSFYALEKEACERLGLKLVDFTVTSREAPSKEQVRGAKELFETMQYPALMHCKSGADRAGVMGVLYAHFRLGMSIRDAVQQLSFRYLHVKAGKTGRAGLRVRALPAGGGAAGDQLPRLGGKRRLRPQADQGGLPGELVGDHADGADAEAGIATRPRPSCSRG
jgi:protein tyrosine/serine phosphatase